jgi:hypothetical protein
MKFTRVQNISQWIIVVACSLAAVGCGGGGTMDAPPVSLTDIHSIEDLRFRFVNDAGSQRVILLLSPT